MNIEHQLNSARTAVRRMAEELRPTWDLPITWFQDMMISEVFGYLLRGRIKHDRYQKPCSFNGLWNDVLDAKLSVSFVDNGKYMYNEFYVSMDNISYHIEERNEQGWHAEPSLNNTSRLNIPSRARLSSESFIRFIDEFNMVVPMIRAEAEDLHAEVAKREFTDTILLMSIESVITDALRDTEIPFSYELKNGGVVFRFRLKGHTGLRVRIPAEEYTSRILELPALLNNPEEGMREYGKDFRYERLK